MEKFGIFNLLSALSSLAPENKESDTAEREENAPPQREEQPSAAGMFTTEQRKTRAAEMLERHEKIARRIGRRP